MPGIESAAADRRNPLWGGLEGRSPPNAIRTRRHARRVRKPCAVRFSRIDKWNTLLRGCRKGRPAPSCAIRSGGMYAARSGCKPLPLSCSGRALRAQEHDVPFAARLRNSLAAKDRRKRPAQPAFFDKLRARFPAPSLVCCEMGGGLPKRFPALIPPRQPLLPPAAPHPAPGRPSPDTSR